MIKVRLLRPLDGKSDGEIAEYPEVDAKRLQSMGVVEITSKVEAAPVNKMIAAPDNKDVQRPGKRKAN